MPAASCDFSMSAAAMASSSVAARLSRLTKVEASMFLFASRAFSSAFCIFSTTFFCSSTAFSTSFLLCSGVLFCCCASLSLPSTFGMSCLESSPSDFIVSAIFFMLSLSMSPLRAESLSNCSMRFSRSSMRCLFSCSAFCWASMRLRFSSFCNSSGASRSRRWFSS